MTGYGMKNSSRLAWKLMDKHGLVAEGWIFQFSRGLKTLGQCFFNSKRIQLSKYFVSYAPRSEVKQIILHEIAHALAGKDAKHGPAWKDWCHRLKIPATVCHESDNLPPPRYRALCRKCLRIHERYRLPSQKKYCNSCTSELELIWVLNKRLER